MKVCAKQHSPDQLLPQIEAESERLGFDALGVSDIDLCNAEAQLLTWLKQGFHGEMDYMQRHSQRRSRPQDLVPGTVSVISVRMNYLTQDQDIAIGLLECPENAYVSRYALGRDYHKLLRNRLAKLAKYIEGLVGHLGYRVFTDSAPVLEKPIAEKAGLGWVGKHSNILCKEGSWFFLGEIYLDTALPHSVPVRDHCGDCTKCIDVCPTKAIVAPYVVDARRCISYLTIEYHGVIPEEFRKPMGNRIYGCDDCQLFCPWNRFAKQSTETDFSARQGLDDISLLDLFAWTEAEFLKRFEGSPIRRIGYQSWLRNIAIALGNTPANRTIMNALRQKLNSHSALLDEHLQWAIEQHQAKMSPALKIDTLAP